MTESYPKRAMAIIAHPDDIEFLAGGTTALWCAAGAEVSYVILTNGNKGSDDPEMTPEGLAEIRRTEQQAAADVLGVKELVYLEQPDGELLHTLEIRKQVVAEIRRFKPDTIITFDPTNILLGNRRINHADHRAAGEIALDAVYPAAGNRMYNPDLLAQGLEPHSVKTVYLMMPRQPNLWVDITEVFDLKMKASLCHASQFKDPEGLTKRFKERHQAVDQYGREVYREEFHVLHIG